VNNKKSTVTLDDQQWYDLIDLLDDVIRDGDEEGEDTTEITWICQELQRQVLQP